jgi:hypothetical protein
LCSAKKSNRFLLSSARRNSAAEQTIIALVLVAFPALHHLFRTFPYLSSNNPAPSCPTLSLRDAHGATRAGKAGSLWTTAFLKKKQPRRDCSVPINGPHQSHSVPGVLIFFESVLFFAN